MRFQAERVAVISENLANVSTAGYHGHDAVAAAFAADLHTSVRSRAAQGSLRRTDVDTDLALVGPGYFAVATPEGVRYTRDGRMTRDAGGFLCDSRGHQVLGALGHVRFPAGARVDAAGRIFIQNKAVDRLRIVALPDAVIGTTGYASAPPGAALERARARVQQRYLEDADVDPIAEMSELIGAQRAFEANQKALQRADETLKRVVSDVARARS